MPEPDVLSSGPPDEPDDHTGRRGWPGGRAGTRRRVARIAVPRLPRRARRIATGAVVVLVLGLAYVHGQGGGDVAASRHRASALPPLSPRQPSFAGADARSGRDFLVTVADTYAAVVDPQTGRELAVPEAVPGDAYAQSALTVPGHLLLVVAGDAGLQLRLVDLSSGRIIERLVAQDVADGLPGRTPWIEQGGRWRPLLTDGDGDADDEASVRLAPGERLIREIDAGLLTLAPTDDAGSPSTRLVLRSAPDGRFRRDLSGPGQLLATTRSGAVWLPRGRRHAVDYVDGSGATASLALRHPLLSLAAATTDVGGRVALLTGARGRTYLTVAYLPTEPRAPRRVYYGEVRGEAPYRIAFAPDGDAVYLSADRALWQWRSGGPPLRLLTLRRTPIALLPF